jgi:hypothetical protein
MELISIVDCNLCVTLPPDQHVPEWELPLPETWGRLSTILARRDWDDRWSPDLAHYASALDIEEVRVCRACGTHYHYRQVHDPHFSEPRKPETDWYLSRLAPTDARAYYIDHTGPTGVVEHLDGGWLDQQYETIIGLLRRDLPRAPDLQLKRYIVQSLYTHYVDDQDWEGLRATLIDWPDPAVGVYVASMIFFQTDPEHLGRLAPGWTFGDKVSAILRAEPARERLLVAVLAEGLSAQDQMLRFHSRSGSNQEPVAVAGVAMQTLRTYVPRKSLASAVSALAAALQRPDSTAWWRETARDLLIKYVEASPEMAKEVLEALVGDSDEARAVRTHCQRCLAQSVS